MGRLMEDLDGQDEVAVDTEADSFYSYREKVCLLQVTVEDRDYLVDPLASGVDISPMGRMFADPDCTKVFHDGEYDVLILKRDHGFEFAGLFDTRVAAATLGSTSPGLGSVIEAEFGVILDKSEQRSDWAKRPLTDKQIKYARLDTHFLLPLMHKMRDHLEQAGRAPIVEGECRRLEALQAVEPVFRADDFVRIKGARGMKPVERQALRELYALREELSRKADVPPFRTMSNQVLLELARLRPSEVSRLGRVHGFSPRMVRRFGELVIDALDIAEDKGPLDQVPSQPKKDGTDVLDELGLELYERLKRWRKGVADKQGIESSYLLNRHLILRLALARPASPAELAAIEGIHEWQLEAYTDDLIDLMETFTQDVAAGEVPVRKPWRKRGRG